MMEIDILILCIMIVCLVAFNIIDRWQAHKRESDLHNRLMARSLDEYAANSVRMTHSKKSEFIGEVTPPEEDDGETYLDVD